MLLVDDRDSEVLFLTKGWELARESEGEMFDRLATGMSASVVLACLLAVAEDRGR